MNTGTHQALPSDMCVQHHQAKVLLLWGPELLLLVGVSVASHDGGLGSDCKVENLNINYRGAGTTVLRFLAKPLVHKTSWRQENLNIRPCHTHTALCVRVSNFPGYRQAAANRFNTSGNPSMHQGRIWRPSDDGQVGHASKWQQPAQQRSRATHLCTLQIPPAQENWNITPYPAGRLLLQDYQ